MGIQLAVLPSDSVLTLDQLLPALTCTCQASDWVAGAGNLRPAYPSVSDHISTEIGRRYGCEPIFLKIWTQGFHKVQKSTGSMDVNPYFSKYEHRVSTKYRNCDVNKCKLLASQADRRVLMGSYCLFLAGLNLKLSVICGCTKPRKQSVQVTVQERTCHTVHYFGRKCSAVFDRERLSTFADVNKIQSSECGL